MSYFVFLYLTVMEISTIKLGGIDHTNGMIVLTKTVKLECNVEREKCSSYPRGGGYGIK